MLLQRTTAAASARIGRLCAAARSNGGTSPLNRQALAAGLASAASAASAAAPGTRGGHTAAATAAAGMDSQVEAVIRAIHATPHKAVIITTGGAAQAASWLLSVPGASGTVLESLVPYSRASLVELLGQEPAQYCSADTALALAKAAYQRAAVLSSFGSPIVGLGATCALASEPPKRGEHRVWVAATSQGGTLLRCLKLAKGARSRAGEEEVAARLLTQVLADACGLQEQAAQLSLQLLAPAAGAAQQQEGDELSVLQASLPPAAPLEDLVAGRVSCVEFSGGSIIVDAPRGPGRVYLPGSFNPLHEGHTAMLEAAVREAGLHAEGCFELTVVNADKGALDVADIQRRVAQFVSAGLPVLVTTACLLVDKARLLPGSTFVVGWDTAVRIVMPKYYGDCDTAMQLVLSDIRHQGCRFLVAGRRDDKGGGGFMGLGDITLPPGCADLFASLPDFRSDVSSTELRAAGRGLA